MKSSNKGNAKKWRKPVVARIKLDPEQAVLAVCITSGTYMYLRSAPNTYYCIDASAPNVTYECSHSSRGNYFTPDGIVDRHQAQALPS